jgi:hypothetical protein
MKNLSNIRNVILVMGLSLLAFSCGKDSGSSSGGGATAVTPQTCAVGQVWVSQANNCVPQGPCPVGQGFYNNACVQGVQPGLNGQCINGMQNGYPCTGGNVGGYPYNGGYNTGYNTGYNSGYGSSYPYYGGGGGNYNTQYYYPYQNNCSYKQWGPFYYYTCGY